MRKAILSFIIALALMTPFCCFGFDESYVENPEIWLENDKVLTLSIDDNQIDGLFQYYADKADFTFYGHISYSGYVDENSEVLVGLKSDNINIEFDDSGLSDSYFNAQLAYQNCKNEVYFAVNFKSKDLRNITDSIRITMRMDGVVYSVCDYIPIDFKEPEKTTKSKQTTTKLPKDNSEKQTTSKSSESSSSKKETITKFKYTYEKTTTVKTESDAEEYYSSGEIILQSEMESADNEAELSLTSKILLAVAGVLVFLGVSLLIHSSFIRNKSENLDAEIKDDEE